MSEKKDPAIKLFGKTIQLGLYLDGDSVVASMVEPSVVATTDVDSESTDSDQNLLCSKQGQNRGDEKALVGLEMDDKQDEEPSSSSTSEEPKTLANPSTTFENPKTLSNEKESLSQDQSKKEDQCDQTSSSQSQDQCPPKKPDKILPCPRCNSLDTKFCYFNNYNVNQPRHFCKNCQRYWTAGGTMRNVPVGAGRRKNKSSLTTQHRYPHLVIPDPPSAPIHHAIRSNGSILAFGGQDSSPFSESMASMLNLAEKSPTNCVPSRLIQPGTRNPSPCGCSKHGKQDSNNTTSNDNLICCIGDQNSGDKVTSQGLPPPLVCFTSTSWPYTWNPIPLPSGFPMSFYSPTPPPPPFLPCNPQGTWNLQWLPTPSTNPDRSSSSATNLHSPSLGKHSRDGNEEQPREEKRSESSRLVIPKTMRIDDPTVAAKSSIWGTLGIKNNDKVGSFNVVGGGFFAGFEPSKDANHQEQGSQTSAEGSSSSYLALQANPAAFSRSLSFHENAY